MSKYLNMTWQGEMEAGKMVPGLHSYLVMRAVLPIHSQLSEAANV